MDDADGAGDGEGAGDRDGDNADRRSPSVRERIRYRFDNLLARGTPATLIWLAAVTIVAVLISSLLLTIAGVTLAGSTDGHWLEDVWQSLLRVIDPGTMASDVGWGRRLLALLITIFGLLVAGTLIGIIAAGVEDRIDRMRRGRSVVIESDHIVVLGASNDFAILLQQLVLAGVEGGSRTIVVLADRDPAELHDAARGRVDTHAGVRIVYRSGDPTAPEDLALARLSTAQAVIVLSDRRSDVTAVKTVLAVAAELGGLDEVTVVVELLHEATAQRLHRAYGASIHPIVTRVAVARTTAFALRQRGLGRVLRELFDFSGPDVHLVERQELIDAPFAQLVGGLTNARPIGLVRADGAVVLCPPFDTRVAPDDRLVVIADSGEHIEYSPSGSVSRHRSDAPAPTATPAEERMMVIGWNELAPQVFTGWGWSTAPTSRLDVFIDPALIDETSIELPDLGAVPITVTAGADTVAAIATHRPTTVVFLAPPGDPAAADVRTLLDVQALRRELHTSGAAPPRLVVELVDALHVPLIELGGPDDLVVSDALGTQFLAQLVDQPARRDVLLTLYAAEHASLSLIACEHYGLDGEYLVRDLVDRLTAHGQVMLGWRRAGADVQLNPHLTERVRIGTGDELVVLAASGSRREAVPDARHAR